MSERSLLERLRRGRAEPAGSSYEERVDSIQHNLTRVFNARQGSALTRPDYGLPAPSEIVHAVPSGAKLFRQAVWEASRAFEPRLSAIEVDLLQRPEDPLAINLQLAGRIEGLVDRPWVTFLVRFEACGRVTLSR